MYPIYFSNFFSNVFCCQECNILQDKNSKLLLLIQKHEMSLNSCSTEISRLEQEKSQLAVNFNFSKVLIV